jgi:SRSO17 transposase
MTELIRVSVARWPQAGSLHPGQSAPGLDQYEHRSWTAWHRHMRLAFLAQLFVLRLQIPWNQPSAAPLALGPAMGSSPNEFPSHKPAHQSS